MNISGSVNVIKVYKCDTGGGQLVNAARALCQFIKHFVILYCVSAQDSVVGRKILKYTI